MQNDALMHRKGLSENHEEHEDEAERQLMEIIQWCHIVNVVVLQQF